MLTSFVSTFYTISSVFTKEDYDTLSSNCALYSSKLLKRKDQVLSLASSSHLFCTKDYKNEKKFNDCFNKTLKICDTLKGKPENTFIFVAVLNKYFY